jgi:hypothetical protein
MAPTQLSPSSIAHLLDFILTRVSEDEGRAQDGGSPSDQSVMDLCYLARAMVLMARSLGPSPRLPSQLITLRQVAEVHDEHPDYRSEWRPQRSVWQNHVSPTSVLAGHPRSPVT